MSSLTLSELQQALREEFSTDKWSLENVKRILHLYDSNLKEYKKHCCFDDCCYVRKVIDQGNDKYNLVLLCWNYGQGTPIHDHPQAECIFRVLEGSIAETQFYFPEGDKKMLEVKSVVNIGKDDIGHINDDIGIHRMNNDSDMDVCVTLHVYFPPYKTVNTYCERTGNVAHCIIKSN